MANLADYVCRECDKDFQNEKSLHAHMRSHKLTLGEYYSRHHPRFDLADGTPIPFKNREHYFTHDFNSRENLGIWLKRVPPSEVQTYMREWLLERKLRKGMANAPGQVELRTLPVPGMVYLNNLFAPEGYYEACRNLGLNVKFTHTSFWKPFIPIPWNQKILVDSRERDPLRFSIKGKEVALKFGDYSLTDKNFIHNCVIERKAVGDLYGTMTAGFERFGRELDRALVANAYMVILVEGDFTDVINYPSTTAGRVHISPDFIFYQVRSLIQQRNNIQFLFVKGRKEASRVIEKIFTSDGQFKEIDLQYAYDTNQL